MAEEQELPPLFAPTPPPKKSRFFLRPRPGFATSAPRRTVVAAAATAAVIGRGMGTPAGLINSEDAGGGV